MCICDYSNIIPKGILPIVLKAHGWIYSNSIDYKGFTLLKPDFYPLGFVLAVSKKAVIVCDGESLIKFKGNEYADVQEIIEQFGYNIITTFPKWEFVIEREWVIKKNGEYIHSFTSFDQIVERKKIRC